ncbi:MAG: nickel-type superoxide dismutase maturation protease [Acidobacteria bacterium]|nr:nickel-type superoxide dismutase maturation protease [Acidobacteriota bacterium]
MDSLPQADWFEKTAWFLGWREVWSIEGDSMYPALRNGDRVLVCPNDEIRVGDIVLANHPFKSSVKIIKRVAQILDDGRYFLVGDDALESVDSRSFGAIRPEDILGRATCRF